jgi:hypothetical protein
MAFDARAVGAAAASAEERLSAAGAPPTAEWFTTVVWTPVRAR